jgi:hypothetical protein
MSCGTILDPNESAVGQAVKRIVGGLGVLLQKEFNGLAYQICVLEPNARVRSTKRTRRSRHPRSDKNRIIEKK